MYETLKLLHVSCACISIGGFALRGYWKLSGNRLLDARPVKVLPHLVDTVLLATAVAMLVALRVSPWELPWVLAKIIALLVYIALGMLTLRFARSRGRQFLAYCLALATASYLVSIAFSKNALGFLAWLH